MTDRFLTNGQLEQLTTKQKIEYFSNLKEYCISEYSRKNLGLGYGTVTKIYSKLRHYDYDIRGKSNIPEDGRALFVCNHSNSHDILTAIEIFRKLGFNTSVLVASDDLGSLTRKLFQSCDAVLIDRRDKNSTEKGVYTFSANIINGMPGVIFGEATWNLHPYKRMHQIKIGSAKIGAITETPIIPTLFEYVEVPKICSREKDLYTECIIHFGSPIYIKKEDSLITQTNQIQKILEQMRFQIWSEIGIKKESIEDIDKEMYLNHTYLKKFDGLGYTYDSESESKFLFSKNEKTTQNEFHLDEKGNFVPGITLKEEGKKYIKR
jgi:1-acyl-sn-glycerol-3-phosphate acyltransferase